MIYAFDHSPLFSRRCNLSGFYQVDHVRLANQLRSTLRGKESENGMVDVVLYTDEQPEKPPTRFCSKRRLVTTK
ncbi:hypothetical protein Y032_0117g662 [Ancylostoma ceylanicum]|uniref:Uncharacterized protein n=1 Tax=Ancylostoma ceylanicum TaxID=53326 RepID=A0A016TB62_9BILA|nr:hypothetical protein Y032_0117g662 [Ancylostoma ceylanicum]